jgi:hypothetical protein
MFCYKGNPIDDDLHEQLDFENPAQEDEEQHWHTAFSTLILAAENARMSLTYVGPMYPSKNTHAMTPMTIFTMISPHIMYIYVLRSGLRLRCVCLMASHTVKKPNPIVNPAAKAAT